MLNNASAFITHENFSSDSVGNEPVIVIYADPPVIDIIPSLDLMLNASKLSIVDFSIAFLTLLNALTKTSFSIFILFPPII